MVSKVKKVEKIKIVAAGSNPDVDSDFHTQHREKVLEYVTEKYGKGNVANIVTFGTLAAKGALKSMCTIYNIPFAQAGKLASLVPGPVEGKECTLDDIYNPESDRYEEAAEFRSFASGSEWKKIIEGARKIEGKNKSTGVHACFAADTLIKTSEGYKAIQEVEIGDSVLTHTNSYKKVVETMVTEGGEIYKVAAANSLPVEVTGNHPLYVRSILRGKDRKRTLTEPTWKTVDELVVGDDLIGIPINIESKIPENEYNLPLNSEDFWWIAGRFVGDGWCEDFSSTRNRVKKDGTPYLYTRQERNVVISVGRNDLTYSTLIEKLENLFQFRVSNANTTDKIFIKNSDVFEYFKIFGKYAQNKVVPDEVLSLPINLLKSFVDGYLSADGWFDEKSEAYTFSTVSRKLALSMASAVNKVYNVHCSVIVENRDKMTIEGREVQCLDRYSLRFKKNLENRQKSFYDDGYIWAGLTKVERLDKNIPTYNFSVVDDSSYVANGLIAHNCGIVISAEPLEDVIPLHVRQNDGRVITQWTYKELESLGLIKMDFLGLDTVDLIQNAVKNIIKSGKPVPNMTEITQGEMDDPKVYELFQNAETVGIFQFGSEMVQQLIKQVKPTEFNDLVVTTAVARPGPMGMQSHVKFADRKNGREEVDFIHPEFKGTVLEEILKDTYGLVVMQESIIKIASEIGGMTLQEGDDLRSAMGKKKMAVMLSMKPKFFEGAMAKGFSEEAVTTLWNTIEEFAKYGFNRCAHGDTVVIDEFNRKVRMRDFHKKWENGEKDVKILSMWEDGTIRPHKVRDVVYTGKRPTFTIKTESGKKIEITEEHRLLTTSGYESIESGGLIVGAELMVDEGIRPFGIKPEAVSSIKESNKNIHSAIANEPVWVNNFSDALYKKEIGSVQNSSKSVQISDGRFCDSIVEAAAAEYLLARGIEFELHKVVENPTTGKHRISDFYANGIYFEMDGMCRGEEWFKEHKYGDVPFVYLTPYNFVDKIDEAFAVAHVENGDKIVEIVKSTRDHKVYDIEMELEGPSNFIANGIVSHNSHSVAYAMNSYQSAYLKTHYPVEFMAALISQSVTDKKKTLQHLREAKRMRLKVGTVDINLSDVKVAPDYSKKSGNDILFGIGGVKSVSEDIATIIVSEREKNGPFESVQDMVNRCVPLGVSNRAVYENLAKAGAFDLMNVSRKVVVENVSNLMGDAKNKKAMGGSLFDMLEVDDDPSDVDLTGEDYDFVQKLQEEANMVGLYLTANPLDNLGPGSSKMRTNNIKKLLKSQKTTNVTILGSLIEITKKQRRQGKSIIVDIDDGTDYMTALLSKEMVKNIDKKNAQENIKKLYQNGENIISKENRALATDPEYTPMDDLEPNTVYMMNITYRPGRDDNPYNARVNWIRPLKLSHNGSLPVRIRFKANKENLESMKRLYRALPANLSKKIPGDYPIHVSLHSQLKKTSSNLDAIFTAAIEEMDRDESNGVNLQAEAQAGKSDNSSSKLMSGGFENNKKKKAKSKEESYLRNWPPANFKKGETTEYATSPEDIAEAVEALNYVDTGLTCDKNQKVELAIEKFLGIENYDFGVFDPAVLSD